MSTVDVVCNTFKVKLYNDEDQWMPERAYSSDAGFDLKARSFGLDDSLGNVVREKLGLKLGKSIDPGETVLVKTGVWIMLQEGWEAQVRPRSGLALKKSLTVLNSPGTVDASYRGEIGVILHNAGEEPITINTGDKIAQLVIKKVPNVCLEKTTTLDETLRGDGGFGSTGQ